MVATTWAASGIVLGSTLPRFCINLNCGPRTDWAAVAPRQTTIAGLRARSSASSQGRQALISETRGFLWIRRLPRGSHLKCLTRAARAGAENGLGGGPIEIAAAALVRGHRASSCIFLAIGRGTMPRCKSSS